MSFAFVCLCWFYLFFFFFGKKWWQCKSSFHSTCIANFVFVASKIYPTHWRNIQRSHTDSNTIYSLSVHIWKKFSIIFFLFFLFVSLLFSVGFHLLFRWHIRRFWYLTYNPKCDGWNSKYKIGRTGANEIQKKTKRTHTIRKWNYSSWKDQKTFEFIFSFQAYVAHEDHIKIPRQQILCIVYYINTISMDSI